MISKKTLTFYSTFLILLCLLTHTQSQPTPGNTQDPYAYAKFSPSMAIIIVILIAALFFIAFFSIYIRHCSTRTTTSSASIRPGAGRRAAATRGLDMHVIETYPTLVYSMVKNLKIGKGALECAVCLCEFEDHELLRLIPKCDHVFHPDCIGEWLKSHTTCPVCRADLSAVDVVADSSTQLGEFDSEFQEHVGLDQEERQDTQQGGTSVQNDVHQQQQQEESGPQVIVDLSARLNRNRTRGSRSERKNKFPRSHSTGHSLVQPGENTDRFTLRLPIEVRKQIMNRKLSRATSMVLLPREGSSRRGYRSGSSRGKYYRRIEELEQEDVKSERWGFSLVGPFLSKMSSSVRSLSRSLSVHSKTAKSGPGECSSRQTKEPEMSIGGSARLPI